VLPTVRFSPATTVRSTTGANTPGERAAGAGLQVAFEPAGDCRVAELERHDERPRARGPRDAGWTFVVPVQATSDVTRQADVVAIGASVTSEDVDEAASFHGRATRTKRAGAPSCGCRESGRARSRVPNFCDVGGAAGRGNCVQLRGCALRTRGTRLKGWRIGVVRSAFAPFGRFGETDFARGTCLNGQRSWPGRSSPKASEVWLGVRDGFRTWFVQNAA
jgi:hypothetical protein